MFFKRPHPFVFNLNIKPFLIFSILVLYTLPAVNHARGEITSDGSMGTNVALDQSNYTISAGTIRGSNQFHSFGQFNVFQGESATFTGPNTINNIIGRVTGGSQSFIDGLLRSEINGANLYLLNPSGVLFGPNASLDVSGSFHVSTADYIRLGNEGILYANISENSVLTIDPPSAFGFLSGDPAGISIQQSSLEVPNGETISLVGGDIDIVGSGIVNNAKEVIVAPSGRINIASVDSAGEVAFNAPGEAPDLKMQSFDRLGNINISSSACIDAIGNPGGKIIIRGGNFFLTESIMSAATNGNIDHPGIAIDIKVSDDMVLTGGELNDAEISSSSLNGAAGDAGDIEIEAGSLQMTGAPEFSQIADVASRVFYEGDGGNIFIKTGRLQMNEFSGILAQVFGSGMGGDITLETDSLQIDPGASFAYISTSTFAPFYTDTSGDAGNLTVNAREIVIQGGGGFTGLASQVATGEGDPDGGKLIVNTDTLQLFDGGQLNAGIFNGAGQAGAIEVTAENILIAGKNSGGFSSGIYSNVAGAATSGAGGDILITANDLQMVASGQIGTYSESPGNSGNIIVKTSNLSVSDGSFLSSTNYGTGEAGDIAVEADNALLAGPSPEGGFTGLFAIGGTFASGAGDIRVETDNLQMQDGAQITARTTGPGMGGKIDIIANHVDIGGVDPNSISIDGPNAGIFTSSTVYQDFVDQATGNAGDINIQANNLNLRNQGTIGAFSTSRGDGGNINVHANNAIISSNGLITTAAEQAAGGDITLTAWDILLTNQTVISAESSGEGNAGNIDITATDTFWIQDSSVTTEAKQSDGGNIKINTEYMVNLWDSEISASVGGGPETVGGNIDIDPEFVTLSNSRIIANAFEGRGGNIQITTDVFIADLNSVVDASSQLGIDGAVYINAPVRVVAQSFKPLPEKYKSAVALLREPCIARISGGKYSSFTVEGHGALPIEPGGLLPSPLIP